MQMSNAQKVETENERLEPNREPNTVRSKSCVPKAGHSVKQFSPF